MSANKSTTNRPERRKSERDSNTERVSDIIFEESKQKVESVTKKQTPTRPSSIVSSTSSVKSQDRKTKQNGRSSALGSRNSCVIIKETSNECIKNDLGIFGSPAPRKNHRANSLPGSCGILKYSVETGAIRQSKSTHRKTSFSRIKRNADTEYRSDECIYHDKMSLDLAQISDFADSDEETDVRGKEKTGRISRRRKSEKNLNEGRFVSHNVLNNSRPYTRRSSLQSFSPRSTASSFESPSRKQDRSNFERKCSLGSSLSRHSELVYSSNSPDFTSEASTCENSPCDLTPNGVSMHPKLIKRDSTASNIASNRATISPNSQNVCFSSSSSCHTSWIESEQHNTSINDDNLDILPKDNLDISQTKERGEWSSFWQNYNNSLAAFPVKFFYDDCPTPFYHDPPAVKKEASDKLLKNGQVTTKNYGKTINSRKNSDAERVVTITKEETKEMIHCAHRLAEILTIALERKNTNEERTNTLREKTKMDDKIDSKFVDRGTQVNVNDPGQAERWSRASQEIKLVEDVFEAVEKLTVDPKDVLL